MKRVILLIFYAMISVASLHADNEPDFYFEGLLSAYQQQLNNRTTWLRWGLAGLSVLSVGLLALIVLSVKQNKKLNLRRLQMRAQNKHQR